MDLPQVAASKARLSQEKELTRRRNAVSAERRRLPTVAGRPSGGAPPASIISSMKE